MFYTYKHSHILGSVLNSRGKKNGTHKRSLDCQSVCRDPFSQGQVKIAGWNFNVISHFVTCIVPFQGTMRHEMHGMELSVQTDEVCSTLVEYNKQDMLCAKGRPPRYDSACNVSIYLLTRPALNVSDTYFLCFCIKMG